MTAPLLDPQQLRLLLGVAFTDEQLEAACAPLEPAVVVAGAGSGKTSVMAARVVWLVGSGQVRPGQVLGLTFTNKAAGELAARIGTALAALSPAARAPRDRAQPGAATEGDEEPRISTYHAFCGRLLAEHALRLGLEPRSRLLADATRFQLAARVLRTHRGPVHALSSPVRMLVGDLVALEQELSEHLLDPADLLGWEQRWVAQAMQALAVEQERPKGVTHAKEVTKVLTAARKRQELAALAVSLREAKRGLDAVDFGDQVAAAARLAEEHPQVGVTERAAASVVLLDEYQDTSVAQRRVLVGLFGGGHPVTAVGDPCQAIYGWRGASVSNLDRFPEHFPRRDGSAARVLPLSVNQRSGGLLLEQANALAAPLRAVHRVVRLRPCEGKETAGRTVVALHTTAAQEVAWVAERLRALVDTAGVRPGECAVLVRTRSGFAALHAALTEVGLPVEVVGLGGLLAVPEVADVVATLRVVDEPTANAALVRLLTGPRWRLGLRDLAALGRRAADLLSEGAPRGRVELDPDALLEEAVSGVDSADIVSLSDALPRPGSHLSEEARARVRRLGAEIDSLRQAGGEPLLQLVQRVLRTTGLDVELALRGPGGGDSLAAFLDVVAGYADLDGEASLPAFLAFLDAADEHERGLDLASPSGADAVQVMTVHKAKGLEWQVVAVPDLTESVFPQTTLRDRWTTTPRALPAPLRGDSADLPVLAGLTKAGWQAHEAALRAHQEREERRLGYVAVTRAKSVLLASAHWWGPTQSRPRGPSDFLRELRERAQEEGPWEPEPVEQTNPHLHAATGLVWPAALEPAALSRRREAAAAVREATVTGVEEAVRRADEALAKEESLLLAELDAEVDLLLHEAREERCGRREVVLPAALTATQLLRLRADPDGLAHDLARPLPRPPSPAARRGTRFHAWVEEHYGQRPLLDPDELPGAEDAAAGDDAGLAALQAAYLASSWAARRPYALEAPFALVLAGRVVRGRIDAVFELGDGRWDVVDWKTGSEIADPLQLAVYRLAWARLRSVPVSRVGAAFHYVRADRTVRPPLLEEQELEGLLA